MVRRIALSLLIAGACAAIAYLVANALVVPETDARELRGDAIVAWITLVVFAVSLAVAVRWPRTGSRN